MTAKVNKSMYDDRGVELCVDWLDTDPPRLALTIIDPGPNAAFLATNLSPQDVHRLIEALQQWLDE